MYTNLFVEMPCNLIGSEYCSCLYAFLMWEKIWMSYICEHFDTKSLWQQKRNGKNFGTDMKNFRGQDLVRATLAINEKKKGELCNPYPRIKAIDILLGVILQFLHSTK